MILNRKRYAFLGGMAVMGAITYVNRRRLLTYGLNQIFKALPPDDPDNGQHVFGQQQHDFLLGPRSFSVSDGAHLRHTATSPLTGEPLAVDDPEAQPPYAGPAKPDVWPLL